jgi:hypothetical protein
MNGRSVIPAPLQIDEIRAAPYGGVIGIALCPGHSGRTDLINRNLSDDLASIISWGADMVLTLMQLHEFSEIGVPKLPKMMRRIGVPWHHLPIIDTKTPDRHFEGSWSTLGPEIIANLKEGAKIFIHCRGGLGRSGTIAARLLVEIGHPPEHAIDTVRLCRSGAIENYEQETYILALNRLRR